MSVARMAMQHAVNANLLRTWITKAQGAIAKQMVTPEDPAQLGQAFVPVKLEPTLTPNLPAIKAASPVAQSAPALVCMQVRLPNGVSIDFGQAPIQELSDVIHMLSALPCSH